MTPPKQTEQQASDNSENEFKNLFDEEPYCSHQPPQSPDMSFVDLLNDSFTTDTPFEGLDDVPLLDVDMDLDFLDYPESSSSEAMDDDAFERLINEILEA